MAAFSPAGPAPITATSKSWGMGVMVSGGMNRAVAAAVFVVLAAAAAPALALADEPPPWAADPVARGQVPKVYLDEQAKADNKATCPLLVITDVGVGKGAKPRRANFAGGWAVAYDRKGQRSAFGVAGAGVEKGS